MNIKAKVYYDILTGNVIIITSEMQGCVLETTKEEDMQLYEELKEKNASDIDFIELEYGTLVNTFTNAKSYSVNTKTKQLKVTYYTQGELENIQKQVNKI